MIRFKVVNDIYAPDDGVVITLKAGGRQTFSQENMLVVVEDIGDESVELWGVSTYEQMREHPDYEMNHVQVNAHQPSAEFYPIPGIKLTAEYQED